MRKKKQKKILIAAVFLACMLGACSLKEIPDENKTREPVPESQGETPGITVTPEQSATPGEENGETITNSEEGEITGPLVAVYVGNYLYDVALFDEAKVITVDQGDGKVNEVTLTGDAVYMSHSTCENQDCLKQGEITVENHETRVLMDWIICLPNQVTIEFIAGDEQ